MAEKTQGLMKSQVSVP